MGRDERDIDDFGPRECFYCNGTGRIYNEEESLDVEIIGRSVTENIKVSDSFYSTCKRCNGTGILER